MGGCNTMFQFFLFIYFFVPALFLKLQSAKITLCWWNQDSLKCLKNQNKENNLMFQVYLFSQQDKDLR